MNSFWLIRILLGCDMLWDSDEFRALRQGFDVSFGLNEDGQETSAISVSLSLC